MTRDQIKYCGAIMRNLKKHRDAAPFLHPVDYLKLNVPDYPKVIRHPMDLTTVDHKLNNGDYENVEEFITDIRLVFNNCFKFNGPEAMISMLCQNVESAFEKSLRQMPPSRGVSLCVCVCMCSCVYWPRFSNSPLPHQGQSHLRYLTTMKASE